MCDWRASPVALYGVFHGRHQRCRSWALSLKLRGPWSAYHKYYSTVLSDPPQNVSEKHKRKNVTANMCLNLQHYDFCYILSVKRNVSTAEKWLSDYSVLLVVITVVDNYKTQVKPLAQVKQVVCLCFSPAIVMKMYLILLLRVHWYLHCL